MLCIHSFMSGYPRLCVGRDWFVSLPFVRLLFVVVLFTQAQNRDRLFLLMYKVGFFCFVFLGNPITNCCSLKL